MAPTFDLPDRTNGSLQANKTDNLVKEVEESSLLGSGLELINDAFDERYQSICEIVALQFDREVRLVARMQLFFAFILLAEMILALSLFAWLGATIGFALALSAIFLTTFASFVTLIYLTTARSHRLVDLRDRFTGSCRQHLNYQEGRLDHHLTLAEMTSRLAMDMSEREYGYLQAPRLVQFLHPYLESLSAWHHWRDVHDFRKLLLESVIEESLSLVRCDPLNIEVHANLANAYVLMASLFCDPTRTQVHTFDDTSTQPHWIPPARVSPVMERQFRYFSSRAVEEFKIISDFAPDDPWVHAQLAYSYHDLKMPVEEIHAYEALLDLCPKDEDARFRLGLLYFQQGMNAQGLEMYSMLQQVGYAKAHQLISFYGHHATQVPPSWQPSNV